MLYAHASRVLHKETNPYNALPLIQGHGDRDVWINPPPIPLETEELDWVFELPYARRAHPAYGEAKVPAFEMIQHSVNIMRGCFGGCTFCSITESSLTSIFKSVLPEIVIESSTSQSPKEAITE